MMMTAASFKGSRSLSRWVAEPAEACLIAFEAAVNQHFSANIRRRVWQAKNGEQNNTSKRSVQEHATRASTLGCQVVYADCLLVSLFVR
jgi:hypothetical protein